MCGIFGIFNSNIESKKGNLNRMSQVLQHRGPDGSGIHYFNNCALGHTRLTIIDMINGDQPMLNLAGNVGLTFNGEIYGYKAIKTQINYPFNTTSDTEVLLALYQEYGINLLEKLPGMFSFGLWDVKKKILFCARDRFGEKPFYYAFSNDNEFIFASEIKAIIASRLIDPQIDEISLQHYLKRLYVHPSKTIYSNIFSLPPAHYLTFQNDKCNINSYWELPEKDETISLGSAVEKFKSLFDQAVKNQLVADVPVGAFLSGGLDSTTVVNVASQYNSNLKTFSFGFTDKKKNELQFARAVAEKYGTEHKELTEDDNNLGDILIQMQTVYDEPFADSSNMPTYLLSKLASEHIKVVLSGDGGDELLAGYSYWYSGMNKLQDYMHTGKDNFQISKLIPQSLRNILAFPKNNELEGKHLYEKYGSLTNLFYSQRDFFNKHDLKEFGFNNSVFKTNEEKPESLDDALRLDLKYYLPGDILVKTDRASMANSLEIRSPFLDVDLASFCISLSRTLKINKKTDKILLREAYANQWPEPIQARKKMGFGAPVQEWLRRDEFIEMKREYLGNKNKKIHSYLDYQKTKQYVDLSNYQTWILLVLSLWLEHR